MTVILELKGLVKPHDHKKMRNSLSIIKMERSSKERVRRPTGANISDGLWGVTAPSFKYLALVENISGSLDGVWKKSVGPRRL